MAYDSNQFEDTGDIFGQIYKTIYQNLKQATTDKETTKEIPTLSCELMISHFESPKTFWNAIEILSNKQGDNVKLLKNTNTNNPIVAIIPNTKNNGNQKNYYKYHLSIYMHTDDDDDDNKSDANESEENNELDDPLEKTLESGNYRN